MQLDHLAPVPVGDEVLAEAVLESVEGRRLTFRVSVKHRDGLVAAGRITRVVVERDPLPRESRRHRPDPPVPSTAMGDPGNPTDPGGLAGSEPDPDQPGWASPTRRRRRLRRPRRRRPSRSRPQPAAPQPRRRRRRAAARRRPLTQPPGRRPPAVGHARLGRSARWGAPAAGGAVPPVAPAGGWLDGQTPGPAPKKRRLTWLWILIPVLLVFVASVVVDHRLRGEARSPARSRRRTTTTPTSSAGDYAAAYDQLCCALAARHHTQSQFVDLQRSDAQSKGAVEDYNFTSSELHSNDNNDDDDTVRRDREGHRHARGTQYDSTSRCAKRTATGRSAHPRALTVDAATAQAAGDSRQRGVEEPLERREPRRRVLELR